MMILEFSKLGPPFTTYPKKRKRTVRGDLRNVKKGWFKECKKSQQLIVVNVN